MGHTIDPDSLKAIWEALNEPSCRASALTETWQRVADEGWMAEIDIEDALLMIDGRLDRQGLKPSTFAALLELPWRWVFHRPDSRFDEPSALRSLSATDAAALLILLQRLGFTVDPAPLCDLLRPTLSKAPKLTGAALDVMFHNKSAQRTPPLTLATNLGEWRGRSVAKMRTGLGYRVEYALGGDGVPMWLTVSAPKFRKRPEPTLTECPECGVSYVKGLPSDDKEHRRTHRLRRQATHPEPHRRFIEARESDPLGAPWVDATSPAWKHELMYRRAFAFKREAGYDFTQWNLRPSANRGAVGYLLADADGRVFGAASFQPDEGGPHPWRLDWVWLALPYRRQGRLAAHWEMFRQRFGEFSVEHPLSEGMRAFLKRAGAAHLIRDYGTSTQGTT